MLLSHGMPRRHAPGSRLLFLLTWFLTTSFMSGRAEGPKADASTSRLLQAIRVAEEHRAPDAERGALLTELGIAYALAADFPHAEEAYSKALLLLRNEPPGEGVYAATLEDLAALYLTFGHPDAAESTIKQALAVRQQGGDPLRVAICRIHDADVALVRHHYKTAEWMAGEAMEVLVPASGAPPGAILSGWITLSYARCGRKHFAEALDDGRRAVAFAERSFPQESAAVGFALETLGHAEWKRGAKAEGERHMQEAIRILRSRLAPADPRLAGVLLQYHDYLVDVHRMDEARAVQEQMRTFCSSCTVSVTTLARGAR
jgi:tetratricopeptide (TPR) repeat protein